MSYEVWHASVGAGVQLLELRHWFTAHLSEYDDRYAHGKTVVAETDDLVGVLEARVGGGHPLFRLPDHGYVDGQFVREQRRGRGPSERLLAAEEWFAEPPGTSTSTASTSWPATRRPRVRWKPTT